MNGWSPSDDKHIKTGMFLLEAYKTDPREITQYEDYKKISESTYPALEGEPHGEYKCPQCKELQAQLDTMTQIMHDAMDGRAVRACGWCGKFMLDDDEFRLHGVNCSKNPLVAETERIQKLYQDEACAFEHSAHITIKLQEQLTAALAEIERLRMLAGQG